MFTRALVALLIVAATGCHKDAPVSTDPATATPAPPAAPAGPEDAGTDPDEDEDEDEDLDDLKESGPTEQAPPPLQQGGPITFKLHNLCSKTVTYGIAPLQGETSIEDPKTIKGGAVEEVTAEYGLGIHLIEQGVHSAAATEANGGHVWISSTCKGVGASDDPKANPAQVDRELREKIERMKKAAEQPPAQPKPAPEEEEVDEDEES